MKYIAIFAVTAFCLAPLGSLGKETQNRFESSLKQVPAAELPAKAASLVKQAKAREWGPITLEVVKGAAAVNPAAAPAVVGSIAKAVPEMAPTAAGAAATEQPKLASSIARAAAAAAPGKTEKIVAAVCKAVPNEYRSIALAVSEAVPGSGKAVLKGVATALPELRDAINDTLLANNGKVQGVAVVLDQASAKTSSATSRGPAVGPPYVPYPAGGVTTISPNTSGQVLPGQRDYARP